jgi:hypothetical protein
MDSRYLTPGVHREPEFPEPPSELRTGVPVFLGFVQVQEHDHDVDSARPYTRELSSVVARALMKEVRAPPKHKPHDPLPFARWAEFEGAFGEIWRESFLPHAVRGFFENGGSLCYVHEVHLDWEPSSKKEREKELTPFDKELRALKKELVTLETLEDVDLVCAPDIMWRRQEDGRSSEDEKEPSSEEKKEQLFKCRVLRMQSEVLKHCRKCGDRFAILDTPPDLGVDQAKVYPQELRSKGERDLSNGALYYPWVRVLDGPRSTDQFVPPCGHVAGVYARTDERSGVHKAPANEVLEGVLDLRPNVSDFEQGKLNPEGVNCLRAFPGRGIRVWGARTLSTSHAWRYVNVRRLFLTAGRWIERNMTDVVFEPHDANLWERIRRDLYAYFNELFRQGAFKGSTPQEAFYIKCDADLNPQEVRDLGHIVTEIGLAPALPNEFVVVRLIHSSSGITITGPTRPGG